MKKFCIKCNQIKSINDFWVNQHYCKICQRIVYKQWYRRNLTRRKISWQIWYKNNKQYTMDYKRKYRNKYPWVKTQNNIRSRLINSNFYKNRTYKKIKNFLTLKDLKYLWFRDKAYLLKQPSIDRLNSKKDYILKNCRYIEFKENCIQGGKSSAAKRYILL